MISAFPKVRSILIAASAAVLLARPAAWADGESLKVIVVTPDEGGVFGETLAGLKAELTVTAATVELDLIAVDASGATDCGPLGAYVRSTGARVVVTLGQGATKAALSQAVGVPVVAGLVASAADLDPARRVTGVYLTADVADQLRLLRDVLPGTKRVGIVYDEKRNAQAVHEAEAAAEALGMSVVARPVATAREIPQALASLSNSISVLLGLPDPLVLTAETAREVLLFSFRSKIPFVGPSLAWAKAGALYGTHWDYGDIGRQLGEMVRELGRGAAPTLLSPRVARRQLLILNGKTAEQMDIPITPALRARAHQIL